MQDTLSVALLLLGATVAVVAIFRRLSMPAILGYLLVGALIGPGVLGLVSATEDQRHLAEFGVVFLMFSIGLEFSLPQLMAMRRTVFGFGGAQVALTMAAGIGIAMAAGASWSTGFIIGGILAMSSTAIVSKTLSENGQLHSPAGRQIMGVLLFQDLAVIPLLVLIPALALPADELASALGVAVLKAAVVLMVVLLLGQRLMRPLFHLVAKQKSSELFVLLVLFVTLGLAWVTEMAGLSLALGAFLAGMLISETEYRYQVDDYIKPFRDVLLGLFFVTIGMLLDPRSVVSHWWQVGLVLALLLLVKGGLILGLARLAGNDKAVALRVALALAPAGEFGFVLLSLAGREGSLPSDTLQVVLAGALISMALTPVLLANAERIVLHFVASEWTQRAMALHQLAAKSMTTKGHVVVCGYGRSGQALAHFLEKEGISVIALDADPERVRQAAAAGDSVVFGDASRREVLAAAGLSRALAVVVSFADTHRALTILSHLRELRPGIPVIVRTLDDTDVGKLREGGAAEIVAEMVEGSLMLATQTMMLLGVPLNKVLRRLREERSERYHLMSGFFPGSSDTDDGADSMQPRLRSVMVGPTAACVGKTLESLNLGAMDVEVTAVRRQGVRETNPSPGMRLQENDILVLLGSQEALAAGEIRLLQG